MTKVILPKPGLLSPGLKEVKENFPVSKLPKNYFKEHVCSDGKNSSSFFHNLRFKQIPVSQTAFYDLGFDPDFSFDGNFFYKERPVFKFLLLLIKMIRSVIKYPGSFLQAPKEKVFFRELVQIEKIWQESALEKGMLYDPDKDSKGMWQAQTMPDICHLREYQFLKKLSEFNNSKESEGYSKELLRPLHLFNRPQAPSEDSKEQILKEECLQNRDVARLDKWGFSRLGNHEEKPIKHKEFLESINHVGDELKQSIRKLRSAIREEDYEKFNNALENFKNSWSSYINSYSLLKDLSNVYAKEDFFKNMYHAYEKDYEKMKKFDFSNEDEFIEIQMEAQEEIRKLSLAASERLKKKMS